MFHDWDWWETFQPLLDQTSLQQLRGNMERAKWWWEDDWRLLGALTLLIKPYCADMKGEEVSLITGWCARGRYSDVCLRSLQQLPPVLKMKVGPFTASSLLIFSLTHVGDLCSTLIPHIHSFLRSSVQAVQTWTSITMRRDRWCRAVRCVGENKRDRYYKPTVWSSANTGTMNSLFHSSPPLLPLRLPVVHPNMTCCN